MAVTWFDTADVRSEFKWCVDQGITSFKTFMAYKGALGIDDDELFKVLQYGRDHGVLVTVHAENGDIVDNLVARHRGEGKLSPEWHAKSRPPEVEGEATHRAITLARFNGTPLYIVHMTCDDSLSKVRAARATGQVVYAETCPQYLVFDDSVYTHPRGPDPDGRHRPLSLPVQGPERGGAQRLLEDPERRARHPGPHERHVPLRGQGGPDRRSPVDRHLLHAPGAHL